MNTNIAGTVAAMANLTVHAKVALIVAKLVTTIQVESVDVLRKIIIDAAPTRRRGSRAKSITPRNIKRIALIISTDVQRAGQGSLKIDVSVRNARQMLEFANIVAKNLRLLAANVNATI
ncbi:hypothetical protein [Shouchella tritolerans]|uniref:hypothetical protein n=1 Tax=Shouchella tritolerans TaxID=2979466 RepID=UPI0021E7C00A|nr:hypothetical protein [Shouchella tritolerans]